VDKTWARRRGQSPPLEIPDVFSTLCWSSKNNKQRLQDRERRVAHCEAIHLRLGRVRLALALVTAAVAWESLWRHALSPWWILLPPILFVFRRCLSFTHLASAGDSPARRILLQEGLARIEDRWPGTGQAGDRFNDPHHVYAADLDLFGSGGLFELLSTARTRMGEETLAHWLLSPSAVDQITQRHTALRELRDQLDFREDLAILGEDASVGVYPEALFGWAEAPNQLKPAWLPWFAPIFVIAAIAGVVVLVALGNRHALPVNCSD